MSEYTKDQEIIANKEIRVDVDAVIQKLRKLPGSRERSLCLTKLQEAVMWAGMDLKRLNEGVTCYPDSYNTSNTVVQPCADGLKL